jgi:hypothetical protein
MTRGIGSMNIEDDDLEVDVEELELESDEV